MPQLTWLGDDKARRAARHVPYRLLETVQTVGDAQSENLLIQGDNLEALKSLLPLYAGRVKCIFIDPPYNTKSAFEHYDDNLEHSQWLSMMYPRLVLLRELLAEDGSIWVTIDDNEAHYLKVVMDEAFDRACFVADVSWKRRDGAPNDRKIGATHDHILVFAKSRTGSSKKTLAEERFNLMTRTEKADSQYRLYEEPFGFDERGPFRKVDSTGNAKGGRFVESLVYPVTNPFTGQQVFPRKGRCWVYKEEEMLAMVADRRFFWGKDGKAGTPMRKLFKSEAKSGMTAPTIWDDVGLNQHAAREIELLFGEKAAFETPKPEGLMRRIVEIATNSGDLVLDSFLGSGTTAAVAHKMGRRWIGIEMGEHARTHCLPRLEKVIEGEQGGISQAVGWQGGGGFRFARLGETVFDAEGRINPQVRFAALAAWLWFAETGSPLPAGAALASPLLGVHGDTALVLLYNGILGDRRPQGGNVLTQAVWEQLRALLPAHRGPWRVFGEACRLGPVSLKRLGVSFRQIPYDLGAR
jgi:adenine-specific DNA-methyltransferase